MDRQLTIRREGEHFHIVFHNYQGPFEGRQIGSFLDLQEVDAPGEEEHEKAPELNQYFLWEPMSFHPDLHALVAESKLPQVAELVNRLNLHVMEGEELLPHPAPPPGAAAEKKEVLPEHHSITEEMEKLHESVWHKGSKEIFKAFLLRFVPMIILVLIVILIIRHLGDPYSDMSMQEAWVQSNTPPASQSLLAKVWSPDKSHMVRVKLESANFAGGSRVICGSGEVLQFHGISDIRGVLKRATGYSGLPEIEAVATNGKLDIRKMKAGNEVLLSRGTIARETLLPRTAPKPSRVSIGSPEGFWDYDTFDLDDKWALEEADGKRVSLEGTVIKQDTDRILRFKNGAGVKLEMTKHSTPADRLLALFEGDPSTIQVDGVLSKVYPLENAEDPARSRHASKLVGELTVYSASAQNFHAVDRR